jgi:type II secretory pathway component PulC
MKVRLTLRKMLSHITILNILLAVLSWQLYLHLNHDLKHDQLFSTQDIKKPQDIAEVDHDNSEDKKKEPIIVEYSNIVEKNLFHPERMIPPEKKVAQELPKPEIVLYGTMITEEAKIAYVEDLKAKTTTPGRGPRQRPIKKGEMISGFTVKDITEDKIILQRGEESITVSLLDPSKKKQRQSSQPLPAVKQPPTQPQQAPNVKPTITPAPQPQKSPN